MNYELLQDYGIDYRAGVKRFMNDKALYETLLRMFLTDDTFGRVKTAYENGDARLMFECAHELKGACGNISMTELYEASVPLVEALRYSNNLAPELPALFDALERAYVRACTGITLAINN